MCVFRKSLFLGGYWWITDLHTVHPLKAKITDKIAAYLPVSILAKILLAHLRNASSTFSPVRALASMNINSGLLEKNGYLNIQFNADAG